MLRLVTSRVGRRLCFCVLFASVPVALFAATATQGSGTPLSTAGSAFNYFGSTIFALAVLHTFLAPQFMRLAHRFEQQHREELRRGGDSAEVAEAARAQHEVSDRKSV